MSVLKITRQEMIKELKSSILESVMGQLEHKDYSWIVEVLENGFVGFDDMPNPELLQEYWDYFEEKHVENEHDDIEIVESS